jgi:hypothetical protein
VWIDPEPMGLDQMPRVAIAVRSGDFVLGSIWAAVHEPLSDERSQALVEAAKVVALHMLSARAGQDADRRVRSDLISTALDGGVEARDAISRLGLPDQPVMVFALEVLATSGGDGDLAVDSSPERMRVSDAFAVHLAAADPRSVAAPVGSVTYGLVPARRSAAAAERRAVQIANEFLGRVGKRVPVIIGVGPVARTPGELSQSRSTAGRVLRVLRAGRGGGQRAAALADVHFDSLLVELQDIAAARGDRVIGPLSRLMAYDTEHKTNLLETLSTWFDAFGDVAAVSSALAIHPNTLRYRLRRIGEVCEIDLNEPRARLAMMLQVWMLRDSPGPVVMAGPS